MWQYGGRSNPRVYHHGPWRFPLFFGNLDRPVERNVFNGSLAQLETFWQRHGLPLRR